LSKRIKINVHSKIFKYLLTVSIDIFKTFEISKIFINSQIFEDNNFIKLLKALIFSIFKKEIKYFYLISKISITGGFKNLKGNHIIHNPEVTKSCVFFSLVSHSSNIHFVGITFLYKYGIFICHQ